MYFPNGQKFNVILEMDGNRQLMHEPITVVPRAKEWFCYRGQWFYIRQIRHFHPVHGKLVIYLIGSEYPAPRDDI